MTAPGGGTVGSILGYLRLDRSDWDREIDEANRKADELGRNSPDVRIRTNSAAAIAQLSAVAAAARRLQDAQGREAVAEARLAELRAKDGVAQSRILRAEQQLAAARRSVAEATIRMAAAQHEGTQSTDRQRESTDRANKSLGMLANTLIFLGPAAIPVLAGVTGAVAGIVPTAAAAALAVLGIRDAWRSGALQGSQFASQVDSLKDELGQLKQTAAAGVLPGLVSAMMSVQPLFTVVNGDISIFSRQLGQIVQAVAPALVRILTDMQPLFTALGDVLVSGANRLAAWAISGNGVQSFINYVIAELPAVLHTLGQLLTLVGHLAAALAPIGSVVIAGLGLIAGVLNKIPVNVLTGLAAAALTVYAAFKVFAVVTVIIDTVRAALIGLTATTVIGALLTLGAAIAAFAFGMGSSAASSQAAKDAMDSYKDSVEQSTNALNEANQAQTLKNLRDQGALTTLDQLHAKNLLLGVSYDDLVSAVNGNADAFKRLQPGIQDAISKGGDAATAAIKLGGTLGTLRTGLQQQIESTKAYNQAADQQQQKFAAQDRAVSSLARALGATKDNYDSATQAAKQSAQQTAQQTVQWQLANDAGSLLAQTLDTLSGKNLSYAQAQNSFDSALSNMGDHITAQGKKITFTTRSINNMSAASVALRGQLLQQVQGAEQTAEAYGKMQGSSDAARQKLVTLRQQIIDNAVAHGVDRQAVTNYIDTVLKIPKKVPPTKLDVDKRAADKKLASLHAYLSTLTDRQYHINVALQTQVLSSNQALALAHKAGVPVRNASGGTIPRLAGGGAPDGPSGTVHGPGSGLSDLVHTMLSPGEEVTRASQASKWRGVLKAINSGRLDSLLTQPTINAKSAMPAPVVYVQNPFTGEYLLAQVATVADQRITHTARQMAYS